MNSVMDFQSSTSQNRLVSMPNFGFSSIVSQPREVINVAVLGSENCLHQYSSYSDHKLGETMCDRIQIREVRITKIEPNPAMDKATVEGTLDDDGEKWAFRSRIDDLCLHQELVVVTEKAQDEDGQYLRLHEVVERHRESAI